MLTHERVVPVRLREDATAYVANLPLDLTKREANKIVAVIMSLVDNPTQIEDGDSDAAR